MVIVSVRDTGIGIPAADLDREIRQATGIGKAPHIAEFIAALLDGYLGAAHPITRVLPLGEEEAVGLDAHAGAFPPAVGAREGRRHGGSLNTCGLQVGAGQGSSGRGVGHLFGDILQPRAGAGGVGAPAAAHQPAQAQHTTRRPSAPA